MSLVDYQPGSTATGSMGGSGGGGGGKKQSRSKPNREHEESEEDYDSEEFAGFPDGEDGHVSIPFVVLGPQI